MPELLTVGHGTLSRPALVALLAAAGVDVLVDVRTAPESRRHPHVARAAMEIWIPDAGMDYSWERRLGGWRKPAADSPNLALREEAFRGYADHIRGAEFWAALDGVLATAATRRTAVMCSEADYRRCHRRLLADAAVLARGSTVRHIAHDGPPPITDSPRGYGSATTAFRSTTRGRPDASRGCEDPTPGPWAGAIMG